MSKAIPTQPKVSPPPTMAPLEPRRITVDEYDRIITSGSFNLVDRWVEVYSDPGPAGYASRNDFPCGQQVPVVIGGRRCGQIGVDGLLP
jgi:hypothetical protein